MSHTHLAAKPHVVHLVYPRASVLTPDLVKPAVPCFTGFISAPVSTLLSNGDPGRYLFKTVLVYDWQHPN